MKKRVTMHPGKLRFWQIDRLESQMPEKDLARKRQLPREKEGIEKQGGAMAENMRKPASVAST
jgi:hypothetical protein